MPAHNSGAAFRSGRLFGDLHRERLVDDDLLAVTAVRRPPLAVARAVGGDSLHDGNAARRPAWQLSHTPHVSTRHPMPGVVARGEPRHFLADGGHHARDLVTRDEREQRPAPLVPGIGDVRVAYAAVGDVDEHVPRTHVPPLDGDRLEALTGAAGRECPDFFHSFAVPSAVSS